MVPEGEEMLYTGTMNGESGVVGVPLCSVFFLNFFMTMMQSVGGEYSL